MLGATWKLLESVEKGDVLGIDAKKHEQDAHAAPNPDLGRVGAEHAAIGRRLTMAMDVAISENATKVCD